MIEITFERDCHTFPHFFTFIFLTRASKIGANNKRIHAAQKDIFRAQIRTEKDNLFDFYDAGWYRGTKADETISEKRETRPHDSQCGASDKAAAAQNKIRSVRV